MTNTDKPKYDRRPFDTCDECGQRARLNPIYASHSADVTQRLCDECTAKRQIALESMWRGE